MILLNFDAARRRWVIFDRPGQSCLPERFFNKIKQCRRIATRYDKLATNYLAFVQLASIRLWLRVNESTPSSFPANPENCYHPRQLRVHSRNPD
jgi:hypothetical protein